MKIRTACVSGALNTGVSKCPINYDKVIGAIIVEHGVKLPKDFYEGKKFEELIHADRPNRIYPVARFVEYAKNGGEPQTSAVGYGPSEVTSVSALVESFTLDEYNEGLVQALGKTKNKDFDVYFLDASNVVYGYNDGTEELAGIPMGCIYATATPHPTSSAKATLVINFSYLDAEDFFKNSDFVQLDYNPLNIAKQGLTQVKFVNTDSTKYKLVETVGGYDRTPEFGEALADGASTLMEGVETASYADGEITITLAGEAKAPKLKAPSALYAGEVKFIEGV